MNDIRFAYFNFNFPKVSDLGLTEMLYIVWYR
nr:MAG TPA: hypothetical protein [Caudoviricetes sp.]